MNAVKLLVISFILSLLILVSCFPSKPEKFYYSPRSSYSFKLNDTDKFQQNFTFTASKIMYDDKPDTFGISFVWASNIVSLRQVDSIHILMEDSSGNDDVLSFYSPVIFRDLVNTPYNIKYIPLEYNKEKRLGDMFNIIPNGLDSLERLKFFSKINIPKCGYPNKLKMKLEVFLKDRKMNFETEFGKARNISEGPSNRPFG